MYGHNGLLTTAVQNAHPLPAAKHEPQDGLLTFKQGLSFTVRPPFAADKRYFNCFQIVHSILHINHLYGYLVKTKFCVLKRYINLFVFNKFRIQ